MNNPLKNKKKLIVILVVLVPVFSLICYLSIKKFIEYRRYIDSNTIGKYCEECCRNGTVEALDPYLEEKLWEIKVPGSPRGVAVKNDIVILTTSKGSVFSLNTSEGEIQWHYIVPEIRTIVTEPIIADNKIFFITNKLHTRPDGTKTFQNSKIYILSFDGKLIETINLDQYDLHSSYSEVNKLDYVENQIIVTSEYPDVHVYAISTEKNELSWIDEDIVSTYRPDIVKTNEETSILLSGDTKIYSLNPENGEINFTIHKDNPWNIKTVDNKIYFINNTKNQGTQELQIHDAGTGNLTKTISLNRNRNRILNADRRYIVLNSSISEDSTHEIILVDTQSEEKHILAKTEDYKLYDDTYFIDNNLNEQKYLVYNQGDNIYKVNISTLKSEYIYKLNYNEAFIVVDNEIYVFGKNISRLSLEGEREKVINEATSLHNFELIDGKWFILDTKGCPIF